MWNQTAWEGATRVNHQRRYVQEGLGYVEDYHRLPGRNRS